MPALTLRQCGPSASSTAHQCAQRRMPRMLGIRRCAHGEAFFRFRETKRLDNSVHACANDPLAGMGEMSIVRAATEVPGSGHPLLSALWDARGLAIGKLCRSVSAGIGQIGVLSSSPMRGALRAEWSGREKVKPGKAGFPMIGKIFRRFSNDWKKCFQWLENSAGGRGRVVFGLREDWRGWMGFARCRRMDCGWGGQTGGKGGRGEREKGGRSVA